MAIKVSQFFDMEISQELAAAFISGTWIELRILTTCADDATAEYVVLRGEAEVLRTQSLLDAVDAYNALEEGKD